MKKNVDTTKKIKVSIIVPIYNSEKYLSKCIDSIIKQKYKNIEILLIDDGSNDKSYEICKEYLKKDKRIKVFSQKNSGPSSARNLGLDKASGEYIIFVDSDDYIESDFISTMMKQNDNYDVIISNYNIVSNNKVKFLDNKIFYYDNFLEFIVANRLWGPVCKLIKKDIIKNKYNENYSIGEDLLFWYDNYKNIKTFKYIDEYKYYYVQNYSSLMNDKVLKISKLQSFEIFNEIINNSDSQVIIDNIKKTFIDCYSNYKKNDNENLLSKYIDKKIVKKFLVDILKSHFIKLKFKLKILIKFVIYRL